MGNYKVASFEDHVEQYRIVSDEIFGDVAETLARYENSEAPRPPMPADRKAATITKVVRKYAEFLGSTQVRNYSRQFV